MKKFLAITLLLSVAGSVYAADSDHKGEGSAPVSIASAPQSKDTSDRVLSAPENPSTPEVLREPVVSQDATRPVQPKRPTLSETLQGDYPITALGGAISGGGLVLVRGGKPKDAVVGALTGSLAATAAMVAIKRAHPKPFTDNEKGNKAIRATIGAAAGFGAVILNLDPIAFVRGGIQRITGS